MKIPDSTRVLYAEDNEDACCMVKMLLGFSNIEVVTAKTVADAWQLAKSEYFDLYLLDSYFPDGSGLDLCRKLREYAPQTPILVYSANAYKTDVQNAIASGANGYLIKPYFEDLAVSVEETIQKITPSKLASEIIIEDVQIRV